MGCKNFQCHFNCRKPEGWHFPGGPVAKIPPSNVGGPGSIPDQRTRSHMLQRGVCMLQLKILHTAMKIEHTERRN